MTLPSDGVAGGALAAVLHRPEEPVSRQSLAIDKVQRNASFLVINEELPSMSGHSDHDDRDAAGLSYRVPRVNAQEVLKALSNETRYRIVELLQNGPLSVSEIARELGISQPTVTSYIGILEKVGLVSSRIQRSPRSFNKLCYVLFNNVSFSFQGPGLIKEPDIYRIELPVGHYTAFQSQGASFLASEAGMIASSKEYAGFFHPNRMEAELLVVTNGEIHYFFPHNIPNEHEVVFLELSMELAVAFPDHPGEVEVLIAINDREVSPFRLDYHHIDEDNINMADWYPQGLSRMGSLCTCRIDSNGTTLNGRPAGRITPPELGLDFMQPIAVRMTVRSESPEGRGIALFGKAFGRYEQSINLAIGFNPKEDPVAQDRYFNQSTREERAPQDA